MSFDTTIRSKIIIMSFITLITSNNVQSMEEDYTISSNVINTNNIRNNDEVKINSNDHHFHNLHNILDGEDITQHNHVIQNSVIYNSNDNLIRNIIKRFENHPTNYEQQTLEGINIINNKDYNQEYEKFLFSIDDSSIIQQNNIKEITNNIDTVVKDIILNRNEYDDDVLYKDKTEDEKVNSLCNAMINYYNGNLDRIFDNNCNCITNKYDISKIYIPFKLLQIMYNSIKKYDRDIAYKTINKVYNKNKDAVHDFFKDIYNSKKFNSEINKKEKGFLGSYNLERIPNNNELEEQKGKALADYWEYANRSTKMFPSINVHYTDKYLKEAYRRWSDNIQYDLNNIIEKSANGKSIDNILNYYARVANRAPNIYLSNNIIDFIHKKLGINDVIYFIDKFIKIKQQYLTEDDLPQGDNQNHPHGCHQDYGNFHNSLNEYPNGNIKEYKVNIYNQNCIACIFNSSDQYGNAGANRIIINNEKEELYNRLMDANTVFNTPRWHINKYSRVNNDGNKEYNTLFLYYAK